MNINDLLQGHGIRPEQVLVLRHRPHEAELNKVLPWIAAERPEVFNAYQQTQGERLQRTMQRMEGTGHVASFIGHEPGKATFVGLYSIQSSRAMSREQFWQVPAYNEMKAFGMKGFAADDPRSSILWFDLELHTDFYPHWKGKLIVDWPPPERSWWRRAHKNVIPIHAILEDSALESSMPEWTEIVLTWEELGVLPKRWRSALSQWRGVYYIYDEIDGKGYVGSAYGEDNLLGRWLNYVARGHGGNRLLRQRDPRHLSFSILQRVSPDMEARDVIRLEVSWKERLHSRSPGGLNDN